MKHAHAAELQTGVADTAVLDDLEAFGVSDRTYMSKFYGHCLGFSDLRLSKGWVLVLARQYNLQLYVRERLGKEEDAPATVVMDKSGQLDLKEKKTGQHITERIHV